MCSQSRSAVAAATLDASRLTCRHFMLGKLTRYYLLVTIRVCPIFKTRGGRSRHFAGERAIGSLLPSTHGRRDGADRMRSSTTLSVLRYTKSRWTILASTHDPRTSRYDPCFFGSDRRGGVRSRRFEEAFPRSTPFLCLLPCDRKGRLAVSTRSAQAKNAVAASADEKRRVARIAKKLAAPFTYTQLGIGNMHARGAR